MGRLSKLWVVVVVLMSAQVGACGPPSASFVRDHCLFVNSAGHCVRAEVDRVTRTPEDLVRQFASSGKDTLVVYFHGGLVPAEAALQEVSCLDRQAFAPAGAYTVGIVWNSDAVTMAHAAADESGSVFADPIDMLQGVRLAPFVYRELARPAQGVEDLTRQLKDFTYRGSAARRFLPWVQSVTSNSRPSSVDARGSSRVRDFELTTGPLLTGLWDRMKRSISLGCNTLDANAFAPRFVKALSAAPPKHLVLVGHSAGSVYIARFLVAARALYPNVKADVIFMAPAITYREMAADLNVFRSSVSHFRMYALDDATERQNTVLNDLIDFSEFGLVGRWFSGFLSQTYPGSLLYYVSNALEGPADVPLLGMQRFLSVLPTYTAAEVAAREAVLAWLQPADNVGWSHGSPRNVDPKPGFATGARAHGDFWSDPPTLNSIAVTIRQWTGP